ncbi:MAG: hypothetical protein LBU27_03915 [Candidatus Peribacteria bacterium]|nr:hypothetical protein [Candidatus Peribacteria bacterium]
MVVVLLARIFILWVVIAIAPIIILLKIFEKEIGSNLIGKDSVFALDNIRKLLLAPVLISFALSLSTMFIMILKSLPSVTPPNDTMSILGLFEINIKGAGANISQLIIRVIGLGLVRFLLFWAIEQNKI